MKRSDLWRQRVSRYRTRSEVWVDTFAGAASWNLAGGRRFYSRHFEELASAHKWCFVVGCNNSGTSLLQSILERSGLVSTFPHEGQRYTRVIKPAWKRGYERVWSEYLDELRRVEPARDGEGQRLLHDWLRKLTLPVQETIVEKTTANAVRTRWLQSIFPRSYFIGLVRNGYAVTEGILRKGGKSVARGARHWRRVNEIMMDDARHLDRFMELRYEDLARDPQTGSARIARFLELDIKSFEQSVSARSRISTLPGLADGAITDMNADSIARLSRQDMDTIEREAAPMLAYYGYDSNSSHAEPSTPVASANSGH